MEGNIGKPILLVAGGLFAGFSASGTPVTCTCRMDTGDWWDGGLGGLQRQRRRRRPNTSTKIITPRGQTSRVGEFFISAILEPASGFARILVFTPSLGYAHVSLRILLNCRGCRIAKQRKRGKKNETHSHPWFKLQSVICNQY